MMIGPELLYEVRQADGGTKTDLSDLAMFGGEPAFRERLHVGGPNIGDRGLLKKYLDELLDRKWLTNHGPFVQEFERRIAELLGVKHCISMCNGTVALEIAIRALELKGEVIIPSFTFIATAHALQWQEITPVFCDIDPVTHTIDPGKIEELITPRTSGIIGVHLWGQACDVDALTDLAHKHRLRLLFDAAHAFRCSYKGQMIGGFGDAEVLSFHATKFFNTFEGGAVVTNNDDLAKRIRLMSNFGFEGYDNVVYIGTNGKMPEVCAAMGLVGLDGLPEFVEINRANYECFRDEFARLQGVRMLPYDEDERCNYQYIVLEIDSGIERDLLIQILHAENIIARRYFYPGCHRMEPYRSFFPHSYLLLPQTERIARRILVLPTGTSVGPREIKAVAQIIRFSIENGEEIMSRLSRPS